MKKSFLLLFLLSLTVQYAQINFEKGYYIDNSGKIIEGFIKNVEWRNNPTTFEFKSQLYQVPQQKTIENVKEFGIYNNVKFKRFTVDIDRSLPSVTAMSTTSKPDFHKELLFLKVLVEGNPTLYKYVDDEIIRFFYHKQGETPKQLVYKKYKTAYNTKNESQDYDNLVIKENKYYKFQLKELFKDCSQFKNKDYNIPYKTNSLIDIFKKYHKCKGQSFVVYNKKRAKFNLWLQAGVTNSITDLESTTDGKVYFTLPRNTSFTFGFYFSYTLPLNKNKWEIFIEPSIQSYDTKLSKLKNGEYIHFKNFSFPFGMKYNMFIGQNVDYKVFVKTAYVLDMPYDESAIDVGTYTPYQIENHSHVMFGAGFAYKDTYRIEVNYNLQRNILNYVYRNSMLTMLEVKLSYRIL